MLCNGCNYIRLNGESQQEAQLRKSKDRQNDGRRLSTRANANNSRPKWNGKISASRTPIARTPIKKKFRKPTGELALFQIIWEERPHISEISGQSLGEFNIRYFSHILTKGAYPSYRLNPENIKMVTPDEHDTWEFGDRAVLRTLPKWDWVFERADRLKYLYYNPEK